MKKVSGSSLVYYCLALATLLPGVSSGLALLLGVGFAWFAEPPQRKRVKEVSTKLLQASVVGLGAGMNLGAVLRAGAEGFVFTWVGIIGTFLLGMGLSRVFQTRRDLALLIHSGTAICGGSAIAAVSSTIGADDEDISTSLAIVFLLNSVALFLFPVLGHAWGLTETQFGYWAAIAIHDTSSVVGASLQYGPRALEIATVVKLARAAWIIPLALVVGWFWRGRQKPGQKRKYPWFILGFVAAAAIVTWVPELQEAGGWVQAAAKRGLVLTLFLIGSGFPRSAWGSAQTRRAVAHGLVLWICVASASLVFVRAYF